MIEKIFLIVLIVSAVVCVCYFFVVLIDFIREEDYNTTDELIKTLTSSKNFLKKVSDDELEQLMKEFDNYEVWVHEDEKQVFITNSKPVYTHFAKLSIKPKPPENRIISNSKPKPFKDRSDYKPPPPRFPKSK